MLTQGSQHFETPSGASNDWAVEVNDDIQLTRIILPNKYEHIILLQHQLLSYRIKLYCLQPGQARGLLRKSFFALISDWVGCEEFVRISTWGLVLTDGFIEVCM